MSLVHSSTGDPLPRQVNNQWLWNELWANHAESAITYYTAFAGFDTDVREVDGNPYILLVKGEENYAAIIQNPVEGPRTHWMPYIKVEDPESVTEKVIASGGSAIMEPRDDVRSGTVAILLDPWGAPFVVQKWPID